MEKSSRDSESDSPVQKSKKARLDDGCNNNEGCTPTKANNWPYSADTSLVEPEILEEMGVSMLNDEDTNLELPKNERTQEPVLSLVNSEKLRETLAKEKSCYENDEVSRGSSSEALNCDRLNPNERGMTNFSAINSKVESNHNSQGKYELQGSNDSLDDFRISRRRRKPMIPEEDEFNKLSDEMILMILKYLPKTALVRSMSVCKRWYRIAQDEALWTRVDLSGKVLNNGTLGYIVPRGVQIMRMSQAEVGNPVFSPTSGAIVENFVSKLQYLDLSMAVISTLDLAVLLSTCSSLLKLSLDNCTLDNTCCQSIAMNSSLEVLNLSMCNGLNLECIQSLVRLKRLLELNIAWAGLDNDSVTHICQNLSPTVTGLNISGCRKAMQNRNIFDLVKQCPNLVELDVSDCTILTSEAVKAIMTLRELKHLSLSRCYSIPTQTLLDVTFVPNLRYLDIFGVMAEATFKTFMFNAGDTAINKSRFSTIARPTVGVRRTSIWGQRVRD